MEIWRRSIVVMFSLGITAVEACDIDASDYVGWEIFFQGHVTGYVNNEGSLEESFEGCEYGRALIINETFQVICQEYKYSYAYRPEIVILRNGSRAEACIENDMFRISLR